MRKEQTLFVVCGAIAALLIWGATGKYQEVDAASLPAGKSVDTIPAVAPDPVADLSTVALTGRGISAQVRSEKRAPLPEIPAPGLLALLWVRPVPAPGPMPDSWRALRTGIVPKEAPPPTDATNPDPNAGNVTDPDQPDDPISDLPEINKKPYDAALEAKLVGKGGEETTVQLIPDGPIKGQPDWVILEQWSSGPFIAVYLDSKGKEIGRRPFGPQEIEEQFTTVHLRKTLLNEFHEERIRRGVKDGDREAMIRFAQWVYETLPSRKGAGEERPYGLAAIRLAIEILEKVGANDLALARTLGGYYRAVYDVDGELRTYQNYVAKRPGDSGGLLLLAEAYERHGLHALATSIYEKLAQTGDAEAKLRAGLAALHMGRLKQATETLRGVASAASVAPRAALGLARAALRRGDVQAAASFLDQAKPATAASNLVLGSVQYAQGRFADAGNTFATAAAAEERSTAWRSNRGMALLAAGDLDGAKKEFDSCLDEDPLNLLDPLFGLGEVHQRNGLPRSVDVFETAYARAPDHPWILLRLGTARLRDGQPEKALALGMRLLEVAPGCTEGLWLVGRAASSLEKPDWEKAIDYLRRAVQKEPDNRDFLYEFGRALAMGGRMDEAVKVLEAATSVTGGVGRSDARLLALLAWARFHGKRPVVDVFEALERAKRANPDDPTKDWLTETRRILDVWDATRVWEDTFDPPAKQVLSNGWTEADQANGVKIGSNDKGHLVFVAEAGKARAASDREGATRVYRMEDLGRFRSAEATFKAMAGVETIFHMTLGQVPSRTQQARRGGGFEIGVGCDRNGFMVLWVTGHGTTKQGTQEVQVKDAQGNPRPWPMDDFHTVRIVRTDDAKGYFEIWLDEERLLAADGKPTFEVPSFSKQANKKFNLGFLVDADTGASVDVAVDWVRVTNTTK